MARSITLSVDFSKRRRDYVYIIIPDEMAMPTFKEEETYEIPVEIRLVGKDEKKIKYYARPDINPRA